MKTLLSKSVYVL
uniref:Uncharacterized protein n=1 Tax=Anguilla anguilla TaxID=7936 RepID=A0A0E9R498_ANGAN